MSAAVEGADPVLGPWLPPGRAVELPGRGTTFVRELRGPPVRRPSCWSTAGP